MTDPIANVLSGINRSVQGEHDRSSVSPDGPCEERGLVLSAEQREWLDAIIENIPSNLRFADDLSDDDKTEDQLAASLIGPPLGDLTETADDYWREKTAQDELEREADDE